MKLESLPQAPPTTPHRPWRKRGAIGLLAVLLAGASWAWLHQGKPAAAAQAEKKGPPVVDVYELSGSDVTTLAAGELRVSLPLSGSLTPLTQATVKAKVSGVVLEAAAQEGVNVAPGQVIARLDAADQRARVAQQQAAVDEAQARLSLAKKNNQNSQALLKQNYISQNAYDTTQNSVELAEANLKSAQAQFDLAKNALNDTVIRAPLAGAISKRHVQAGEKVAPDMPVYSIVDLSRLVLEASVPAADIPRVKIGQEVRFEVDGYAERAFSGTVSRINPTTEAGSRAMVVYVSVANADGALRGGMFAKGSIVTEKSAPSPLLPLAAVRRENAQDVVYLVEGGKVVARPVKLGLRNADEGMAEVSAGLAAGAQVIVAKLDGVKPGNKVKVTTPAAKG